jgi:hypothetical protein
MRVLRRLVYACYVGRGMLTINAEEAISYLKKMTIDYDKSNMFINYRLEAERKLPIDSGKKNYIAKALSNILNGQKYLLFVDEFGIWPSSENLLLFDAYRKSIGINESLTDKPAHIILPCETDELYCLLGMIFYFCWGAIFTSETGNEIIRISHDEYIKLYSKKGMEVNKKIVADLNSIIA